MRNPRWKSRNQVKARYGTSDSSLSRWVNRGVFPAPTIIGVNTQRWDENELDEYDADPEGWKARHVVQGAA